MNTALLLIDIQNDYFPGGRMELSGSNEAAIQARRLLNEFRIEDKKISIIHIQHIATKEGAAFFLPNTNGVEFHSSVKPNMQETVIQKHFPNSFRNTELLDILKLREIKNLIICGMMTHMCIDATTRAAFDYGFNCIVASDACATRSLSFQGTTVPAEHVHLSFLAALNSVYAKVMLTDEIIQGVLETKI